MGRTSHPFRAIRQTNWPSLWTNQITVKPTERPVMSLARAKGLWGDQRLGITLNLMIIIRYLQCCEIKWRQLTVIRVNEKFSKVKGFTDGSSLVSLCLGLRRIPFCTFLFITMIMIITICKTQPRKWLPTPKCECRHYVFSCARSGSRQRLFVRFSIFTTNCIPRSFFRFKKIISSWRIKSIKGLLFYSEFNGWTIVFVFFSFFF